MFKRIFLTLATVLLVTFMLMPSAQAQGGTSPTPGGTPLVPDHGTYGNYCNLDISASGRAITNTFTIDGTYYKVIYGSETKDSRKIDVADPAGVTNDSFYAFQMNSAGFNGSTDIYYLTLIWTDGEYATTHIIGDPIKFLSTSDPHDGRAVMKGADGAYWVTSQGGSGALGKYIDWFNKNSLCVISNPQFVPTNIKDKDGDEHTLTMKDDKGATWYYVAQGNYNGVYNATGFIYRKEKTEQYLLIQGGHTGIPSCTFDSSTSHDWQCKDQANLPLGISGYKEPPSDKDISGVIHFGPVAVDFTQAKSVLTNDDVQSGRNITLAALMGGPFGPLLTGNPIGFNADRTGSNAGEGFDADQYVFLVQQVDLDKLYPTQTALRTEHAKHLADTVVVCVHKKPTTSSQTISGFNTIKVLNSSSGNFDDSASSQIHQSGQRGATAQPLWSTKESPLKIDANTLGAQKCGGSEDKGIVEQAVESVANAGKKFLLNTIIEALKAIGQIIQNFIIYVVSWAITLASNNVPI